MGTIKLRIFFFLVLFIFLIQYNGYSQEDKSLYLQATRAARSGKIDFAFMNFRKLLNEYPESKYRQQALFGTGEYYFSIGDYEDAVQSFNKFINSYPESEAKSFAIAYLLHIAKRKGEETVVEKLEKELIGFQQSSLLFRDFEELQYLSPLYKNYKALNFIDKIEIYIDNEIFAKISF